MKVDISSLPQHIQDQIAEATKEPEPLFPVKQRQFTNTHMQTKEFIEMAQKIDQLIEAVNTLYENLSNRK